MKAEDLRQKSDDELGAELLDLKKEAFNLISLDSSDAQLRRTAIMTS